MDSRQTCSCYEFWEVQRKRTCGGPPCSPFRYAEKRTAFLFRRIYPQEPENRAAVTPSMFTIFWRPASEKRSWALESERRGFESELCHLLSLQLYAACTNLFLWPSGVSYVRLSEQLLWKDVAVTEIRSEGTFKVLGIEFRRRNCWALLRTGITFIFLATLWSRKGHSMLQMWMKWSDEEVK